MRQIKKAQDGESIESKKTIISNRSTTLLPAQLKPQGELERVKALSNYNRTRRRVRRQGCLPEGRLVASRPAKLLQRFRFAPIAGFFREGKSHFPGAKTDTLQILRPGILKESQQNPVKAENPKGFQVSPKAKLPTAKSKILMRRLEGEAVPPPQALKKRYPHCVQYPRLVEFSSVDAPMKYRVTSDKSFANRSGCPSGM